MKTISTKCLRYSFLVFFYSFWLHISIFFLSFFFISLSHCLSCHLVSHYELYTVCCSAVERLHFHIDGFFGELENWMLLSIFLVMADAEVEENCTQWPNRSLPSKALQMHLSELNSYELCTQVRDNSAVTEAGNEDELKRGLGTGLAEWYTGVDALKRTHKNDCTRKRKGGKAHTTHTHTYPLNANAIKGRITVKSIRTNLREMKWSKRKMEGKKAMKWIEKKE